MPLFSSDLYFRKHVMNVLFYFILFYLLTLTKFSGGSEELLGVQRSGGPESGCRFRETREDLRRLPVLLPLVLGGGVGNGYEMFPLSSGGVLRRLGLTAVAFMSQWCSNPSHRVQLKLPWPRTPDLPCTPGAPASLGCEE